MTEWISVKDRLPPIDQKVLGINRYKAQEVCSIETPWPGEDATWCTDEGKIFEPSHWMPLPEAPAETI